MTIASPSHRRSVQGFTLVELMVTLAIALFLLGGLVTIVQNVRQANMNQQYLAQLQDEERFAFTVITDAVQAAGYFPDPTADTVDSFGAGPVLAPITVPFQTGWVFSGYHTGANDATSQDAIAMRFMTARWQGPVLCNGVDTAGAGQPVAAQKWTVQFYLTGKQLMCAVNNANPIPLVDGVQGMAIYYGIKRDTGTADYNVDTYVNWNAINQTSLTEMGSVSAVRIVLTFVNPMANQPGQLPTVTTERVIQVMGRAGQHT